jgi:hypothetical protein
MIDVWRQAAIVRSKNSGKKTKFFFMNLRLQPDSLKLPSFEAGL